MSRKKWIVAVAAVLMAGVLIYRAKKPAASDRMSASSLVPPVAPVAPSIAGVPSAPGASAASTPWKGERSGVTRFETVVIRTPQAWKALWDEHTRLEFPPPPAPEVDFSRYGIVGVFAGERPGARVDITHLQFRRDAIQVKYHMSTAPNAGLVTQPFELRLIPKTDLPILFTEDSASAR